MILDEHSSHVSLEAIQIARAVGLDLLTLSSHTSHALQPLDCFVFKPFKEYLRAYHDFWSQSNVGATPSKQTLAQWVSSGLRKALSDKNIKSGFRVSSILPLDREVARCHMRPSDVFKQTCSNDNAQLASQQTALSPAQEATHTPTRPAIDPNIHL